MLWLTRLTRLPLRQYVAPVTKYDRHGYKPRVRWLVATKKGVYVLDVHDKPKLKDRFSLENVQLTVTAVNDQLLLLKKASPDKNGKGKEKVRLKLRLLFGLKRSSVCCWSGKPGSVISSLDLYGLICGTVVELVSTSAAFIRYLPPV